MVVPTATASFFRHHETALSVVSWLTDRRKNMKPMRAFAVCAVFAGILSAQQPQFTPPHTHLKIGDEAPDFTLPDTDNKPVKLSDFRGKNVVVLAFFVAAFTGG
jgi:hypothetical protein